MCPDQLLANKPFAEKVFLALSYMPHHRLKAKRYHELFALARNKAFIDAQTQTFPQYPDLCLRTFRMALTAAAEKDNASAMAEFLVRYGDYLGQTRQESPLETLRSGDLERAWGIADLCDIEHCVQWYLLLACELKADKRYDLVQATLVRLLKHDLPRLSLEDWYGRYAALLLALVFDVSRETVNKLQRRLLLDDSRSLMGCHIFAFSGFSDAMEILNKIKDTDDLDALLVEIATLKAEEEDFEIAIIAIERIKNIEERCEMLEIVAGVLGKKANCKPAKKSFSTSLRRAKEIVAIEKTQEEALEALARAQAKIGEFAEALKTSQDISAPFKRCRTLAAIASEQKATGKDREAQKTYEKALKKAKEIRDLRGRTEALVSILQIQLELGITKEGIEVLALATLNARKINSAWNRANALMAVGRVQRDAGMAKAAKKTFLAAVRACEEYMEQNKESAINLMLREIAIGQARIGAFADAIVTAKKIEAAASWCRFESVAAVVLEQAKTNITAAFETLKLIEKPESRAETLAAVARTQAKAGNFRVAEEAIEKIENNRSQQTEALETIAEIHSEEGRFKLAIETAYKMESGVKRQETLCGIARKCAEAGNYSHAIEIAEEIGDVLYTAKALVSVLQVQTKKRAETKATFTAAVKAARGIEDTEKRAEIAIEIGFCYAELDQGKAARSIIAFALDTQAEAKNASLESQVLALTMIGRVQIENGIMVAKIISAALDRAKEIKNEDIRAKSMRTIAELQVKIQDFANARKTMTTLASMGDVSSKWRSEEILIKIAEGQAQAGGFATALTTAEEIQRPSLRAGAITAIAIAQAKAGNIKVARDTFASAVQTAKCAENDTQRNWSLRDIALGQAKLNWFEVALKTAKKIKDSYERVETLVGIACMQYKVGSPVVARNTLACALEFVENAIPKDLAICHLAEAQAKVENVVAAFETLKLIEEPDSRAEALAAIARVQATSGDEKAAQHTFAKSLEAVELISDTEDRAKALAVIGKYQSLANFGSDALRTVEAIRTDRNNHIPEVAGALAEVGNRVTFKRLLIPCTYYPDVAYKMCGFLAQLYPKQSPSIADTLVQSRSIMGSRH